MGAETSDFTLDSILSQQGDDEKLHHVAFHSCKFEDAEINYEIHDKELLALVNSFAQWTHFLEGSSHQIAVLSDHKNLAYFQNARLSKLHIILGSNKGRQMHYRGAHI